MAEPIATAIAASSKIAGIKLPLLIAGFAGAVVTLSYLKELKKSQVVMALITGALGAAYLTPITTHYLTIPDTLENGAGFLIGVVSMHLIPMILALAERYRSKPEQLLDVIGKTKGEQ